MKKMIITVLIAATLSAITITLIFKFVGLDDGAPIAGGIAGGITGGITSVWVLGRAGCQSKK
jgi:hypothetical protein